MPLYPVPAALGPAILAGTRDVLLIKDGPQGRAKAGGPVTFRPGNGGQIRAACTLRARLAIGAEGLIRATVQSAIADGEPVARLLAAAEQGSPQADRHAALLAERLGFADWAALRAAYALADGVKRPKTPVMRELIAWTGAKAAA